MLRVNDRVADEFLKKDPENTSSLFIDKTTYAFDASTTSKTSNCGLGYSLNVVAKDFAMALATTLGCESLSYSLSATRHVVAVAAAAAYCCCFVPCCFLAAMSFVL
jgi:hypothetical protein